MPFYLLRNVVCISETLLAKLDATKCSFCLRHGDGQLDLLLKDCFLVGRFLLQEFIQCHRQVMVIGKDGCVCIVTLWIPVKINGITNLARK